MPTIIISNHPMPNFLCILLVEVTFCMEIANQTVTLRGNIFRTVKSKVT